MKTFPSLYSARDRSSNIQLIKNLRAAQDQASFDAADNQIALNFHPSLLAELDWMEMTMPAEQRADGAHLTDSLFIHHLKEIISSRKIEFDLSDADLELEIQAHANFYRNLLDDETQPLDGLGESLSQRLRGFIQQLEPDIESAITKIIADEGPRISRAFMDVEDGNWILQMIDVEIQNALLQSLDHIASRMQTKQFMRHIGGQFPYLNIPAISSEQDFQLLLEQLASLGDAAREFSVYRLVAVCQLLQAVLQDRKADTFNTFNGELGAGVGHCGSCSMIYASTAIISYDPACPKLFDGEKGLIVLPYDFNISRCPFCDYESRVDCPSMFYSPQRNQVIYNYPLLGQFSEEEARVQHRPAISAIRESYLSRINQQAAKQFNAASEEFTYNVMDFLLAIQMGSTVKEEHAYNIIRFHDGSGIISDPTKGAIIGLTRSEMESRWAEASPYNYSEQTQDNESGAGYSMRQAMEAFASGEYEQSREILEALHIENPNDKAVRKNLAVAYVTLGDKAAAKKILAG